MKRVYARYTDKQGNKGWLVVTTDPVTGSDDAVNLVWLIQVLLLKRGESPFFANYGIPADAAVAQQQAPDRYVAETQKQFAPFFASLVIAKVPGTVDPTYTINVITKSGLKRSFNVPLDELSQFPGSI